MARKVAKKKTTTRKKAASKKAARKKTTRKKATKKKASKKKATRRAAGKKSAPMTDKETPESLDKVRDLLFGNQMRESDKRFATLEKRLAKELDGIREDSRKRFDTLESFVKTEVDSLVKRIKSEQKERTDAVNAVAKELTGTAKSIDKRLGKLDERGQGEAQEMRGLLLDQSKQLRQELETANDNQSAARDEAVDVLRDEKADRSSLAGLFSELALQISEGGQQG